MNATDPDSIREDARQARRGKGSDGLSAARAVHSLASRACTNGRRRGALIVAVMVCLFLVMAIAGSIVRTLIAEHRQSRVLHQRTQANWLVSAGAERAVARLHADPAYQGETWRISAEQLGGAAGIVSIRVLPESPSELEEADREGSRQIVVEASFPTESPRQVNLEKHFRIHTATTGDES